MRASSDWVTLSLVGALASGACGFPDVNFGSLDDGGGSGSSMFDARAVGSSGSWDGSVDPVGSGSLGAPLSAGPSSGTTMAADSGPLEVDATVDAATMVDSSRPETSSGSVSSGAVSSGAVSSGAASSGSVSSGAVSSGIASGSGAPTSGSSGANSGSAGSGSAGSGSAGSGSAGSGSAGSGSAGSGAGASGSSSGGSSGSGSGASASCNCPAGKSPYPANVSSCGTITLGDLSLACTPSGFVGGDPGCGMSADFLTCTPLLGLGGLVVGCTASGPAPKVQQCH